MKQLNTFNRVVENNLVIVAIMIAVATAAFLAIFNAGEQAKAKLSEVDRKAELVLAIPERMAPNTNTEPKKKVAKKKPAPKSSSPQQIVESTPPPSEITGAPSGYVGAPPVCSYILAEVTHSGDLREYVFTANLLEWQTNARILSSEWYIDGVLVADVSGSKFSRTYEQGENSYKIRAVLKTNFGEAFAGTNNCSKTIDNVL